MKNSIADLNNYLFEVIEGLKEDPDPDDEVAKNYDFEKELKRAKAISDVGKNIIEIAKLQFEAFKYADEYKIKNAELPEVLRDKGQKKIGER